MVQTKFKWKCIFCSFVVLSNVFAKSLPADNIPTVEEQTVNTTRDGLIRQNIRPGQYVRSYELEITVNGDNFDGRAIINVIVTPETREDEIILLIDGLDIKSVRTAVFSSANAIEAEFEVNDQELSIYPVFVAASYIVIIEYDAPLATGGLGLHLGRYNQDTYISMNLNPTYARRVFPCMDDPNEISVISFKFNNLDYTHLVSNSQLEENSQNQFRPLYLPPHLCGMIAHNFININIPASNVRIFGRSGIFNQDSQAAIAINSFYLNLNEWTQKQYSEIITDQNGNMNIIALPDVSTDWNTLSMVGIWEPYVFMETRHSVKQRSVALPKIAEAMARQWFGFVIFPQNWRYEWVVSGLASYAGWEMMRKFYSFSFLESELDVNTLFVTEVIQESLLRDSYSGSGAIEPDHDLFVEEEIRDHIGVNGVQKYKAPALMRMMRNILGDANADYIQLAARLLLDARSLQSVNTLNFIDAVNYVTLTGSMIGSFEEFLEPWIKKNGYPLLQVFHLSNNLVVIYQEAFGFSNVPAISTFKIPITFTTSQELNFGEGKLHPVLVEDSSQLLSVNLGENDWILFNIQGQGYYRVNYDRILWEKIIKTLDEPWTRNHIHPLNRATLIDDALNVARSGRLDYVIALKVVLTMEHETQYAPWKVFVRNMDFLRKRLLAYVENEDNIDPDIYLRIIQKTVRAFEEYVGFYPNVFTVEPAMQSLTRGLVMDHACRAKYQPCIAAAKNWFYDPNNSERVNPNIPHEIRPAVYCTMVREGDGKVIEALQARLDTEPNLYERLVILESLACSQDEAFISGLLAETIASDSPYGVEERVKIFAAVAGSSFVNANLARIFMRLRTSEIRKMYGGPEKLEKAIFILADNMADEYLSSDFAVWVESQNNQLDDSQLAADRALAQVRENLQWINLHRESVYDLIAEYTS